MTADEEIKLAGETARGIRAKSLLENDVYKEAVQAVENGIVDRWKASPVRDIEGQAQLRLMHKLLTDLRGYIEEVAYTGKMAEQQLMHERGLRERAKDAVRAFRR